MLWFCPHKHTRLCQTRSPVLLNKMAEKNGLDAKSDEYIGSSTPKKRDYNHGDKEEETQGCGWFNFRPTFLRYCSSPRYLLVLLCAYFFANAAVVSGIYSPSISTIEKRFSLSRYLQIVWCIPWTM